MVPATPAPAWRVLVAPDQDEAALETLVLQAAGQAARRAGLAGLHIQWPAAGLAARLAGAGDGAGATGVAAWARWDHQVFLWEDRGYGDFDGLLAAFSKNMRRNVQRERAAVRAAGLEMRWLSAAEAAGQPGLLAEVADLYRAHNDRFGPYAARFLEPDFFLRLPEFMPGGWALGTAWRGGRLLAMSFFLEGGGRLYGRYYGAREDLPGLHFELCYYLPLEYALRAGIGSFDPGLGSPHKVRRGFRPRLAPSFHLAFDQSLQAAARPAFAAANRQAERAVAALAAELPYKATSGGQRPDRPD
jgi:hypothetical protein